MEENDEKVPRPSQSEEIKHLVSTLALRQIDLELRITALDKVYDVDCERQEVEK